VDEADKQRITPELAERLFYVMENAAAGLSPFEVDLLNDRLRAVRDYGARAVITPKQQRVILECWMRCRAAAVRPLEPPPPAT
jgi:hypothetical protein